MKTLIIKHLLSLIAFLLYNCGPKDGKSGHVKIAMENGTSTTLRLAEENAVTPEYFGVRLVTVSLRYTANPNDSSAPPEYESGIYIAPTGCSNGGESEIERDDKMYKYFQPANPQGCDPTAMEVLDLARDTDDVNGDLNAGHYPVIPGAYNQATVCFSSLFSVRVDTHLSSIEDIDTADESTSGFGCVDTVLESFNVGEGEYVTVSLDYDLAEDVVNIVTDEQLQNYGGTPHCVASETESGSNVCVNGLNPTPSAVK